MKYKVLLNSIIVPEFLILVLLEYFWLPTYNDNTDYQWLTPRESQFEKLNQNCQVLFERQLQIESQEDHEQHRNLCNTLLKDVSLIQQKLNTTIDQNEIRLTRLKREIEQLRQQEEGKNQSACIACGFASPASSYCPQCGVQRALEIECKHCGVIYHHPVHLMVDDIDISELHCMGCGQQLEYK